jgi:hypothetical protein
MKTQNFNQKVKKNNAYKPLWATLVVALGIFIMAISMISAFDIGIDNYKIVSPDNKTITVMDTGWLSIGKDTELATFELKTNHVEQVGLGYQKVAEFTIKNTYEAVNEMIKGMEFYNMRQGMKPIIVDYDLKYLGTESYDSPIYKETCVKDVKNGSNVCSYIEDGKETKTRNVWLDYTPKTLIKGEEITIGIYTDTKQGDYIEWIPTMKYGKIEEWASYNASMITNLQAYYKLDETSGTNALDSMSTGRNNMTNYGATVNQPGLLGTSYSFDGGDYLNKSGVIFANNNDFAVSVWVNITGAISGYMFINGLQGSPYNGYAFGITENRSDQNYGISAGYSPYVSYSGIQGIVCNKFVPLNQWVNLILQRKAGTTTFYINGVSCSAFPNGGATPNVPTTQSSIGGANKDANLFTGKIDEVAVWNRSLNTDEIALIYNSGLGLSLNATSPTITLNSPVNTYNSTTLSNTFNCTVSAVAPTNVTFYINNTAIATNTSGLLGNYIFTNSTTEGSHTWNCGACSADGVCANGTARTFTIDMTAPTLNITYPLGIVNTFNNNSNIQLNWTVSDTHLDDCWYNYQGVNTTVTCGDGTVNVAITNYSARSITMFANDTFGWVTSDTTTWDYNVYFNSESHNLTNVYETDYDSMSIDISGGYSTMTAYLNYDGVRHATTNVGGVFSYSTGAIPALDVIDTPENRTIIWEFVTDLGNVNITRYQYVYPINLNACTTGTTYLNVTFQDEVTLTPINGTMVNTWTFYLGDGSVSKTNYYLNSTPQIAHGFCFLPVLRTVNINGSSTHSNTGYQARTYTYTGSYDNATDTKVAYLLSSVDGIYVTFTVINSIGSALDGVAVTVTRDIAGADVQVGYGTTGFDGKITFWLNPSWVHDFTFAKSGYTTINNSFAPSENDYTIIMGGNTVQQINDYTRGVVLSIKPSVSATLYNGTDYRFNMTITSYSWDVEKYGFTLTLKNGTVLNSTSSTVDNGTVNVIRNTGTYERIIMNYWYTINSTNVTGMSYWNVYNSQYTGWSIATFFTDFNAYFATDIFGLDEFGRSLIIYLIIFLTLGIMSYKYGITNPLTVSVMIFGVIYFFDVVVDLLPATMGIPNFYTFIAALLVVTLIFKEVWS